MDDLLAVFLAETVECLGECDAAVEALRRAPGDAAPFDKMLRLLRSVRETSGFLGLPSLHEAAQRSVARLEQMGAAADADRPALAADCLSALRAVVAALAQPLPADAPSSPNPLPKDGGREEGEGDDPGILRSPLPETVPSPQPPDQVRGRLSAAPRESGADDRAAAATDGSIRVSAETVENLLSTVTRLMAAQAEMMQMLRAGEPARVAAPEPAGGEVGKVVALAPRRTVPGPAKSGPAGEPQGSPALRLLLCRGTDGMVRALPENGLLRLEEIDLRAVDGAGGLWVMRFEGELFPLVALGRRQPERGPTQAAVFRIDGRCFGLLVDAVLQSIEAPLAPATSARRSGRLGTVEVEGRAVDVVDPAHCLHAALGTSAPARTAAKHPPQAAAKSVLPDSDLFPPKPAREG